MKYENIILYKKTVISKIDNFPVILDEQLELAKFMKKKFHIISIFFKLLLKKAKKDVILIID